jgi:hypothetical protein
MNRLIIILKLAMAMIPFCIFNFVLHTLFPHIPRWVSLPLTLIIAGGAIYYIYSTRKKIMEEENDEDFIPDYYKKSSYFFVAIGSILAYFLVSSSFRTVLYIDNGKPVPVQISISGEDPQTVPANGYIETSATIGENEITVDGKTKKINILEKGRWVYNVDNLNSYIENTVDYANPDVLYKDKPAPDTLKIGSAETKIIHEEFFKLESDYIFEAPESITIKKENQGTGPVTQTVLYRLPQILSGIK